MEIGRWYVHLLRRYMRGINIHGNTVVWSIFYVDKAIVPNEHNLIYFDIEIRQKFVPDFLGSTECIHTIPMG